MKRLGFRGPINYFFFLGMALAGLFLLGSCNCGSQDEVDVLGKACSLDVQCFGLKCINGICQSGEGSYFEGVFGDSGGDGGSELKAESSEDIDNLVEATEISGDGGSEVTADEVADEFRSEEVIGEEIVGELPPEKECVPGEIRSCYTGKVGCFRDSSGSYNCKAPCKSGIQYCEGGFWTRCLNESVPKKESCDGEDNDCDGQVDEGIAGCVITVAGPPPKSFRYRITNQFYFSKRESSIYFASSYEGKIFKFDYYQNLFIEIFVSAGKGFVDGPFGKAKFTTFGPIALDEKNNYLYVMDSTNMYIRRLDLKNRVVSTVAGNGKKATKDGPASKASFEVIHSMIVSRDGTKLFFTEKNCIRVLDFTSNYIRTISGDCNRKGARDGKFSDALFNTPNGLEFDSFGNLVVSEPGAGKIRKLDFTSKRVVTIAGTGQRGERDGPALQAKLFAPIHSVYYKNILYIADPSLKKIKKLENGKISTVAGSGYYGFRDGPSLSAMFAYPSGVFPISLRDILVLDLVNRRLRKIDTLLNFVSTVAGGGPPGFKNGKSFEAQFFFPSDLAVTSSNTLYISDRLNHCIRILDLKQNMVSTLSGICQYSGERLGRLSQSLYSEPIALAYDSKNKFLYVAQRYSIKKLDFINNSVSLLAGSPGKIGCKDGNFKDARFNVITDIFLGTDGSLYLTDIGNRIVRKLNFKTNRVETIAGKCRTPGNNDGKGSEARFAGPHGLYVDSNGDIYVTDYYNHCVRKVDKNGNVSTFIGLCGESGVRNGRDKEARLFFPTDIVKGPKGNLYITEYSSACIRKVDKNGNVSTFIGLCGEINKPRDGDLKSARITNSFKIVFDGKNALYFIEGTDRIRKITLP